MFGIQVGERWFIETPTVYILGEVEEVGFNFVVFKPGAYEIRQLNNLYTFLHDGKFHMDDEVTPCPGKISLPALSIVIPHQWTHNKLPKCNRTQSQMRGEE